MTNKRIFISFAVEDAKFRDMLKGHASLEKSSFDFTDMSVKEPWDTAWQTKCRLRIKGCDGMIFLLSTRTRSADGAKWEMQCAIDERLPILGVHIHSDDKGETPPHNLPERESSTGHGME